MQAMLLTTIGVTGVVIVEVDWRVGKRDAVLVEGKERRARARLEGRAREDVDPEATLGINEWAFYEEEEEVRLPFVTIPDHSSRTLTLPNRSRRS